MFKRLSEPTGEVTDNSPQPGDTETQIVRRAILVHAGPDGQPLTFQSGDGPITFDDARIKTIVKVHNEYMDQLAAQYGNEIPMGAHEPILDAHETDSNDRTIGRLTGRLKYEVRDVPKVGKNVPCAVAEPGITFLGKQTVDRVKDGRIYHLSIGISEKDNRIGETSTVVKPAAPGAMLLKQGQKPQVQGGKNMSVDIKRMKAHTEKLARLSAMKETFGSFSKKLVATSDAVKLTARKGQITHRLSEAMRAGKMTPAEYKNLTANDGLVKLASLDDSTLKIALSPIEARENPVVRIGQIGSTDSPEASEMAKRLSEQKNKNEYMQLRSEFSKDYKRMTGKKLAGSEEEDEKEKVKKEMSGPKEAPVSPGADGHVVPGQEGDEQQLSKHMAALAHHLEHGDIESAKKEHAEMSKCMGAGTKHMAEYPGDVKSEDYKKNMDAMQMQVDELHTQMSRMAGMVEEMMASEKEEGEHFGEIAGEHAGVAS